MSTSSPNVRRLRALADSLAARGGGWQPEVDNLRSAVTEIEQLRELLLQCQEKLRLYRAGHSGEYVGGVEYTELQRRIETALRP